MNLHKKMCIWLSIVFILSIIIFCFVKHAHPTISNILIAIITGAFISLYTSFVNYLHLKEEFFNNLFFTGTIVNSNYEQIKQLIFNLDETSNLKYAIGSLKGYANLIDNIITTINFDMYSPFLSVLKEKEFVDQVKSIYVSTKKSIIIAIQEMEIAYMNIELAQLKIRSLLHPCSCCNLPDEQQLSQSQCPRYIEYQNNINTLNNDIIVLNKYIKDSIKILLENTQNLQSEYINTMNCLHCKTKNKTKWKETIEDNKQYIANTMKEYVKRSINSSN